MFVAFNMSPPNLANTLSVNKTTLMFLLAFKVEPSSQWLCAAEFVHIVSCPL